MALFAQSVVESVTYLLVHGDLERCKETCCCEFVLAFHFFPTLLEGLCMEVMLLEWTLAIGSLDALWVAYVAFQLFEIVHLQYRL